MRKVKDKINCKGDFFFWLKFHEPNNYLKDVAFVRKMPSKIMHRTYIISLDYS
jgi:hypothetical protein